MNKFDAYEFPHINYYHFVVDVTFILFLWFVCCLCYHVIGEYKFHFSKLQVWQWSIIDENVTDVALNILNRSSRFLSITVKRYLEWLCTDRYTPFHSHTHPVIAWAQKSQLFDLFMSVGNIMWHSDWVFLNVEEWKEGWNRIRVV